MDTQTQPISKVPSNPTTACSACGSSVEPGQRYCLSCGEPITAAPEAAAASPEPVSPPRSGGVTPGVAAACVCLAVLFLAVGILVGRLSFGDAVNKADGGQQSSTVQQGQNGTTFNGGSPVPNNGGATTIPTQPQSGGTTIPGNANPQTTPTQPIPQPGAPTP